MSDNIIIEVNPRTKEKRVVKILDCQLTNGYTIRDLLEEHNTMLKQMHNLQLINTKLIDVIGNISKSTAVQIAEIKEEIK